MTRFHLNKPLFLLAPLLSLVLLTAQVASAAPVDDGSWRIVKSPQTSLQYGVLNGVTAISKHDVWAVGATYTDATTFEPLQTVTEHWNGSQWRIIPSPNLYRNNALNSVAAVSANDVWAVGNTYVHLGGGRFENNTLIEHWNGSQWRIVPSPNPREQNMLNGVFAISKHDVWAVGSTGTISGSILDTLILHWNGSQWSVVPSPHPGAGSTLINGWAGSSNNVWAVGIYFTGSGTPGVALIEHWNGRNWSVVASPNAGMNGSSMNGVTVVSASDAWAVGQTTNSNNVTQALIEHWNGRNWSIVQSPNFAPQGFILGSVVAFSSNDVWAAGLSFPGPNGLGGKTLIEHWNGTSWSIIQSPNVEPESDFFISLAADSPNDLWAVGGYSPANPVGFPQYTLIEHCC